MKDENYQATYSPEDNKLRLYTGWLSREEYLQLRAQGWTSTPKQDCDFVSTWTPSRRDTALEYAGVILDEDMSPEERAADRAERFAGYRDKRTAEATGRADNYEAQPMAHGYQSQARAEREARRHDRLAVHALDAWDKAEYWQRRTAGVISHALHKSSPGVRMGRIKTLEAELRKVEASLEKYKQRFETWKKIAAITDPEEQTKAATHYSGTYYAWGKYEHPKGKEFVTSDYRKENGSTINDLLSQEEHAITGKEACDLFFSDNPEPEQETDWTRHLKLRLAYENQMLAAQGGRLEQFEVKPGGKIGGKLIFKINKSPATKRITSVSLIGPRVSGWQYKTANIPGTQYAEYNFDLERLSPDEYQEPSPESLAELEALKKEIKACKPEKKECPLINPTKEEAQRLQDLWNAEAKAKHDAHEQRRYMNDYKPSEICEISQAVYSQNSKGTYARAETRGLCASGILEPAASNLWSREAEARAKERGPAICKIRITSSGQGFSAPSRIIVLTDKPHKPLPAEVWEPRKASILAEVQC